MRVGVFNDFVIDYVDTVSLRHYVGMVVGSMDSGQCVHVVIDYVDTNRKFRNCITTLKEQSGK